MTSDPITGTSYWTSKREGQVQLRMGKNPLENEPPVTVPDLIMSAATKYSHYLAIGSKCKKSWQVLTYIEYYEACRRAAKAFLKVRLVCKQVQVWCVPLLRMRAPPALLCVMDRVSSLRFVLHFRLLIHTKSVIPPLVK